MKYQMLPFSFQRTELASIVHLLQLSYRCEWQTQRQHPSFAVQLGLLQPSILDSGSGLDSMVGSNSAMGSSVDYESVAGSDSASTAGSALGTFVGSESVHYATEECF